MRFPRSAATFLAFCLLIAPATAQTDAARPEGSTAEKAAPAGQDGRAPGLPPPAPAEAAPSPPAQPAPTVIRDAPAATQPAATDAGSGGWLPWIGVLLAAAAVAAYLLRRNGRGQVLASRDGGPDAK